MKSGNKNILINKKVKFNFTILTSFEAGIILKFGEIKSIRNKNVLIDNAFVNFKKNEAFVINMHVAQYKFSQLDKLKTNRIRKLLLHKKEIIKIIQLIKLKKLTVIISKLYFKNNFVKLEISLGKGKKIYDKRQIIKKRNNEKNQYF